ncbi:MAG: DUF2017 domain-containing protein [Frankiaceae bacterium]|nr:DUF2017 domain-containing protein [Frankiaceae bacterium]MBV9871342.1 DUF2017 domain-containing protein [Frankiaceae bacterium]
MGSVRRRADRVRVQLEEAEVWLLMSMTTQLIALLREDSATESTDPVDPLHTLVFGPTGDARPPEDPVLRRLLPDAYADDAEAAGEFRRLTEGDLRAAKSSGLSRIMTDLSERGQAKRGGGIKFELDDDGAAEWLSALTDLRLALGTRIGVSEDMAEERAGLDVDSPRYAEIATYDWLSWLQDAMVRALTGE